MDLLLAHDEGPPHGHDEFPVWIIVVIAIAVIAIAALFFLRSRR